MLLTVSACNTIRSFIGDDRAKELADIANELDYHHRFTTEELVYLGKLFDYFGYLSSEQEVEALRAELSTPR